VTPAELKNQVRRRSIISRLSLPRFLDRQANRIVKALRQATGMYEDGSLVERLEEEQQQETVEQVVQAGRRAEREGKSSPDPHSDSERGKSNEQMWDAELGGEG
jgi:hypothetical protein